MKTTIVHVMRHGEVDNPDGILYERLPGYHLSPLGQQMVAKVATYFEEKAADITAVLASPLERAIESATPTANTYNLDIITDDRLIEASNVYRGMPIQANKAELAKPRNWKNYRNPLTPSWGEPYVDQAKRMSAAIKRALHMAYGHEALVVSHQLPIWCLRSFIEGRPYAHIPSQRECSLASLTSLTFVDSTLVGLSYDEPARDLLKLATDVTPGQSDAAVNAGI